MKLVQLYKQVKEENGKLGKVLVTRRSPDERVKNFLIATNKQIQEYIKNGSKGNLNLENTPITSLPDNLTYVGGHLNLYGTSISHMPNGLTVEGDLVLADTKVVKLPNNLTIGGDLYLEDSFCRFEFLEFIKEVCGFPNRIFPMVFKDGEYIGCYWELYDELKGELGL